MSSRDAAIPIAEAVWGYGAGHVLDAVTSQGHLHFADDCRKGSKRIRSARQAKNVSDRRAGELAEENRVLAAIVRDLAENGAHLSSDEETCVFCETVIAYRTQPPVLPEEHEEHCEYRRACAWLASLEPTQ